MSINRDSNLDLDSVCTFDIMKSFLRIIFLDNKEIIERYYKRESFNSSHDFKRYLSFLILNKISITDSHSFSASKLFSFDDPDEILSFILEGLDRLMTSNLFKMKIIDENEKIISVRYFTVHGNKDMDSLRNLSLKIAMNGWKLQFPLPIIMILKYVANEKKAVKIELVPFVHLSIFSKYRLKYLMTITYDSIPLTIPFEYDLRLKEIFLSPPFNEYKFGIEENGKSITTENNFYFFYKLI